MFTVLLFLVLFVSLLLQFLNYLLPPPAQSPADSPNIQIPASPSNPKSEHEEVPADSPNIQIPASPSNPKLEHEEVPADSTNTQTVLSSLSALMEHEKVPAEASSSSGSTFDVFLSFRGEDTRHGFTDHLYYGMIQKGIIAFRDTEKLERGRPISSDLLKAIKKSRIAVIILSANYATSTWCLEELAQIVECEKSTGLKVLPVFYHVEPSEVRKQTGSFYKAFCEHEKTFADDMGKAKVNKWREALTKVANISGWDLKGRGESEVIQTITTEISKTVHSMWSSDNKDIIGMDARMDTIISYLDLRSNDVRTIGIVGMGGIGKSTLAKAVFEKIRITFDSSCFISDVRGKPLVDLQKLLGQHLQLDSHASIQTDLMGNNLLRKGLSHKKVLIILDNVDQIAQLKACLGQETCLGPGSRVIITTRNTHTLKVYELPEDKIYEVEKLTDKEALQLFCQKAFKENHAPDEYKGLSNSFVKYCSGLPLALEVLGSKLCKRTVDEWSAALARLDKDTDKGIFPILQLSYDGLEETEKEIFLDIACFFRGESQSRVKKILKSCGFFPGIGIPVLIDKYLIKREEDKLWMHDLLQQMGWNIVRQQSPKPGKRSRLWLNENSHEYEHSSPWFDEDTRHVVTENLGTIAVEGIYLSVRDKKEIPLRADPFLKMRKLRLLKICNVNLLDVRFEYLSNELRLLEWHECPLESLPSSFQPDKLVELKLPKSRIETLWTQRLCLEKLRLMDLSYCQYLVKTPDFSNFPNLVELTFQGCRKLSDVHPTLWRLKNLMTANLHDCTSLERLPNSISLQSLKFLYLSGCSKLDEFPEIVGNGETLLILSLDGTAIRELPTTIGCLTGLIALGLRDCKNLVGLPSFICSLKSLKYLRLSNSSRIDQLPEDIGSLENLETLEACYTAIRKVPSSIVLLKNLKTLSFEGCRQVPGECSDQSLGLQLPKSFSGLNSLETLHLGKCDLAEGAIPDDIGCLSSLKVLRLEENNFASIPESISQLPKLREIYMPDCSKLQSLPNRLPKDVNVEALGCPLLTKYRNQLNMWLSDEGIIRHINCGYSNRPLPIPEEQIEEYLPKSFEDIIVHGNQLQINASHTKIPDWCRHQNSGSSVAMQVSDLEITKGLGVALFVVFEIFNSGHNFDKSWELQQTYYTFKHDQGQQKIFLFQDLAGYRAGTYLSVFYKPLMYIGVAKMFRKACRLEASVSTDRPDLEVKSCGLELIFQEEARKFAQNLTEHCNPGTDFKFGRHCKELINSKGKESSGNIMAPNEAEKVSWKFDFNMHPGEDLQLLLSKVYEGTYGREKDFGLFFPHKVVPFWFFHHYAGDVALCDFPLDLSDDQRWVGLELFVMVSSGDSINVESFLDVDLCSNEISTVSTSVMINTCLGPEQLVVIHIPRVRFPEQLNQCHGISAFFRTATPDMRVRMCGSRLLYEQDLEDLIRAITVCTLDSQDVIDSLCQHIQQLLGSYLPEEPSDHVVAVETVEQNSVEGENEVGRRNDHSSTEREDLIQDRREKVFTSILHNYRSYLQQKHGCRESERIISHSEGYIFNNGNPKPVFATHHLHVMVETRLYGSLSSEDWKRSLESLLQYFKVATLSVKGQMIDVLNPFTPSSVNNFCFPRKELPGWFREQTRVPRIRLDICPLTCLPAWFREVRKPRIRLGIHPRICDAEDWLGLAICATFSVNEHPSVVLNNLATRTFNVMCHLTALDGRCFSHAPVFTITKEKFKWLHLRGFMWLTYIPRSYLTEFREVVIAEARIYNDCPGLMMKEWDIRPLFKQDVKEFNKAIVHCWTSFFDNLDLIRQSVEADENEQAHYFDRGETSKILMPEGNVKDFNRDFIYNATYPHCAKLLEWFGDHTRGPSVKIPLPPSLSSDGNWIGLALCARFSDLENQTTSIDKVNPEIAELVSHLETENSSFKHLHHYRPTNEEFKWLCPTEFIWLSYIPRQGYLDQLIECDLLEASFASESRGLVAEECGLHLVYQHDEQEFKDLCIFMNSLLDKKSERLEEQEAPKKGKQVLEHPEIEWGSNAVWGVRACRSHY